MSDDGAGLMSYSHLYDKIISYNQKKMTEEYISLAEEWMPFFKSSLWKNKPKRVPKRGKWEAYPYKTTIGRRVYWKLRNKSFKNAIETMYIDLSNSSGKGLPILR